MTVINECFRNRFYAIPASLAVKQPHGYAERRVRAGRPRAGTSKLELDRTFSTVGGYVLDEHERDTLIRTMLDHAANKILTACQECKQQWARELLGLGGRFREELSHYTDVNGLSGILKDKSIHATHYQYLNDSSELAYGIEILSHALREKRRSAVRSLAFDRLRLSLCAPPQPRFLRHPSLRRLFLSEKGPAQPMARLCRSRRRLRDRVSNSSRKGFRGGVG